MDMTELWEKACMLLKGEMNEISYNTWIQSSLKPLSLEGDCLTLCTSAEYMKSMIASRYATLIANALGEVAGNPMQVEILTRAEVDKKQSQAEPEAPAGFTSMSLNPKYTFDTFVVGNGNRFAHAASLAVAESPAEAYNPLFIYGGVGLGKTHLMHAIGHYVQQQYPQMRLMYITSENFTNELISAIQQNRNVEFRNRFRNVDILMVDDIQFIAGRDSTQEEFFHTFNALHTAGKQIVMTSDKPPKDIARLEERLCSRFEWGLIADIQKPDIETRIAILRKKAMSENIMVGDDVLELIASRIESNIRELEGSLTRLVAFSTLHKRPIDVALCEEALKEVFEQKAPRRVDENVVMSAVSDYYGVTPEDLKSSRRNREITVPRQVAMYLTREMTGLSLPSIGRAFGGRDHSTVLYACNTVEKNLKTTPSMAALVEDIRKLIREGK